MLGSLNIPLKNNCLSVTSIIFQVKCTMWLHTWNITLVVMRNWWEELVMMAHNCLMRYVNLIMYAIPAIAHYSARVNEQTDEAGFVGLVFFCKTLLSKVWLLAEVRIRRRNGMHIFNLKKKKEERNGLSEF